MNEKNPHPSQSENNPPPSVKDWQEQKNFYGSIGLPPNSKPSISRPPLFPQAPPIDPSRIDRTSATGFPILPQQSLSVNALPHDGASPLHALSPAAVPSTEMGLPLPFKASELLAQITANGYIFVKNTKYLMRVEFLRSDLYCSFSASGCHAVETDSESCRTIEQRMPDFSTRRIEKRIDGIKEIVRDRYGRVLYELHVDALGYWSSVEVHYHDADGKISPFVASKRTVNSGGIVKETAFGRQGKPSGTFEWDYSK